MINVTELLYKICQDQAVYQPETDLIASGLLDSLALIELFSELEDQGIFLEITQIDRKLLRTVSGIEKLITSAKAKD
ncbi:D-alanine--poly(phosphoribitol) ligase subunit 2 [Clostridiales bacterium COT073_COT-073]|nr:D-alanine--poly(phosphoribitol) ligase subunit 2 [Clostridiales bacterium COT073_COT-073]